MTARPYVGRPVCVEMGIMPLFSTRNDQCSEAASLSSEGVGLLRVVDPGGDDAADDGGAADASEDPEDGEEDRDVLHPRELEHLHRPRPHRQRERRHAHREVELEARADARGPQRSVRAEHRRRIARRVLGGGDRGGGRRVAILLRARGVGRRRGWARRARGRAWVRGARARAVRRAGWRRRRERACTGSCSIQNGVLHGESSGRTVARNGPSERRTCSSPDCRHRAPGSADECATVAVPLSASVVSSLKSAETPTMKVSECSRSPAASSSGTFRWKRSESALPSRSSSSSHDRSSHGRSAEPSASLSGPDVDQPILTGTGGVVPGGISSRRYISTSASCRNRTSGCSRAATSFVHSPPAANAMTNGSTIAAPQWMSTQHEPPEHQFERCLTTSGRSRTTGIAGAIRSGWRALPLGTPSADTALAGSIPLRLCGAESGAMGCWAVAVWPCATRT